jgi:gamma-glutamylputrescine oxidase
MPAQAEEVMGPSPRWDGDSNFNDSLGMDGSYYAATANPAGIAPRLKGTHAADLVVVGGGCTGLSAALSAAEHGLSVILVEGGRIGWGASGRNGGQMIPGLRKGAIELVANYGRDHARGLFRLAIAARDEVVALVERGRIECDLRLTGHLTAAVRRSDVEAMAREAECLHSVMDYPDACLLDAAAMAGEVAHPYPGGLLDLRGGHLHPLNYTLGLAGLARGAGVRIFEHSPALSLRQGRGVTVALPLGEVRASACVLAGDALMETLDPAIARHIMPVANYIAATRPLDDPAALIPHDRAISDSRFVVNYYRLSADGRLIFGGGERYTPRPPADMAAFVRPFLERTFPQLAGVPIDHAWGGLVSITRSRLPHIGRHGDVFYAHGYSGMGTILSTLAGRLLVDAVRGDAAGFDLFASIAPPAFPGGTALRGPLHTLAMLWYAARDRLPF